MKLFLFWQNIVIRDCNIYKEENFFFERSVTVLRETKISRETFLAYINTCRIVTVLLNEVDLALIITIISSTNIDFYEIKIVRFFDTSFRLTRDQNIQVYSFFLIKIENVMESSSPPPSPLEPREHCTSDSLSRFCTSPAIIYNNLWKSILVYDNNVIWGCEIIF